MSIINAIINAKYKTLCVDENLHLVLETTEDINLITLGHAIKRYRKGEKSISVHIGPLLEFDLTLKMIVISSGYKISKGYFISPTATTEHIIRFTHSTDKIIDLLENFHHLLMHTD